MCFQSMLYPGSPDGREEPREYVLEVPVLGPGARRGRGGAGWGEEGAWEDQGWSGAAVRGVGRESGGAKRGGRFAQVVLEYARKEKGVRNYNKHCFITLLTSCRCEWLYILTRQEVFSWP